MRHTVSVRAVPIVAAALALGLVAPVLTPTPSPAAALPTPASAIAAAQTATDYFYANSGGSTSDASWRWTPFFMGVDELLRATGDAKYRTWLQSWGDRNAWDANEPASPTSNPDGRAAIQVWEDSVDLGVNANLAPSDGYMAADLANLQPSQYWWIDSLFMGLPLWTRWTDRTGNAAYRAKGATFYNFLKTQGATTYRNNCTNTGLFDASQNLWWRDCMYVPQRDANGNKVFWSRGNGWVLAALVATLKDMPPSDPQYAEYVSMLQKMATRIAALQPADGMWRTSLLSPSLYPIPETSGTALFAYAMAYGIRAGFLDSATFTPVVTKAWDGLIATSLKPSGFLSNCQGVGEAPGTPSTTTSIAYCVGAFALAGTEIAKLQPPATTTLASDPFTRTVANGWGSAPTGGAWTGTATVASDYSVNGSVGRISTAAGQTRTAYLNSVSSAATDLKTSASFARPTVGSAYIGAIGRRVGSGEYLTRAIVQPSGAVRLQLQRTGVTLVQTDVAGLSYATGDTLKLRIEVSGTSPTTIRAKVWKASGSEPAAWTLSTTDSTAALQAAGAVGLSTYFSGGGSPAVLPISFDDVLATTPGVTPPPNTPPTAAFTTSAANLVLSVNGSGSTDTDGTIASYAWNFGDGGSATGVTASHTYASAGTYTVTLTVTDDDGAPASLGKSVTVTAAPPPTTLATDTFTRTVTNGWGAANTGGSWAGTTTAVADYSVNGSVGRIATAAGQTRVAYLNAVSSTSTDAVVSTSFTRPTTGSAYVALLGRRTATADYGARAVVAPNGGVKLQLQRSGTTIVATDIAGLTYATGDALRIRIQVTGTSPTTLRAKVWKVGTTEPAAWQLTTTDSTAGLQSSGGVGMTTYFSSGGTPGVLTVSFDDLTATPIP